MSTIYFQGKIVKAQQQEASTFDFFAGLPKELKNQIISMLGTTLTQSISREWYQRSRKVEVDEWREVVPQVKKTGKFSVLDDGIKSKKVSDIPSLRKFLLTEYENLELRNKSSLYHNCKTSINSYEFLRLNQEIEDQNLMKIWPNIRAVLGQNELLEIKDLVSAKDVRDFIRKLSPERKSQVTHLLITNVSITRFPKELAEFGQLQEVCYWKKGVIIPSYFAEKLPRCAFKNQCYYSSEQFTKTIKVVVFLFSVLVISNFFVYKSLS